jgi:hypothetical protein
LKLALWSPAFVVTSSTKHAPPCIVQVTSTKSIKPLKLRQNQRYSWMPTKNVDVSVFSNDDVRMKRKPLKAIIRPLDPYDPRSWDHPSHKEQWLALAAELGRSLAKRDFTEHEAKLTKVREKLLEARQAFDHPTHKKTWLALAESINRAMAPEE